MDEHFRNLSRAPIITQSLVTEFELCSRSAGKEWRCHLSKVSIVTQIQQRTDNGLRKLCSDASCGTWRGEQLHDMFISPDGISVNLGCATETTCKTHGKSYSCILVKMDQSHKGHSGVDPKQGFSELYVQGERGPDHQR
jgi:hypothetical protein